MRLDLEALTDTELFGAFGAVMEELPDRGLVRSSNNPAADYAELLVARHFRVEPAKGVQQGYDLLTTDGTRVQVKARRRTPRTKPRRMGGCRRPPLSTTRRPRLESRVRPSRGRPLQRRLHRRRRRPPDLGRGLGVREVERAGGRSPAVPGHPREARGPRGPGARARAFHRRRPVSFRAPLLTATPISRPVPVLRRPRPEEVTSMATSRATRAGRALFSALIRATRPSCTYDRYRVETSSDRISFSGSWNKLAVVAKEGDLRTKLGPRPHPGTVALRHRAVVALEQSVAEGRSRAGEPPSASACHAPRAIRQPRDPEGVSPKESRSY